MEFRERLCDLLAEKNINYNTLAKKTNIPVTTLSNYINRGSSPSIIQLNALADFFECTVDYLLGREDDFGNVTVNSPMQELTYLEQRLLTSFNKLDIDEKEKIISDVEYFAGKHGYSAPAKFKSNA